MNEEIQYIQERLEHVKQESENTRKFIAQLKRGEMKKNYTAAMKARKKEIGFLENIINKLES